MIDRRESPNHPARAAAATTALFLVTLALSLLAAEGLARLFVDPTAFLRSSRRADPILDFRIEPGSGGHDSWGFRNPEVPRSADIVVIGDSLTHGFGVPAAETWPAILAKLSGKRVYNLGHGGYGPLQYRHLLETRALQLAPEQVVVAVYFGNDLLDAFGAAYSLDHWAPLRDASRPDWVMPQSMRSAALGFAEDAQTDSDARVRDSLRSRSVLAGMAWAGWRHFRRPDATAARGTPVLGANGEPLTRLNLGRSRLTLDLDDERVREGLRLTLDALSAIAATCAEHDIAVSVVLLPDKASVYRDVLPGDSPMARRAADVIHNEQRVREAVLRHLATLGVPAIDPLDALRALAREPELYPVTADQHPRRRGYAAIGESVAEALAEERRQ